MGLCKLSNKLLLVLKFNLWYKAVKLNQFCWVGGLIYMKLVWCWMVWSVRWTFKCVLKFGTIKYVKFGKSDSMNFKMVKLFCIELALVDIVLNICSVGRHFCSVRCHHVFLVCVFLENLRFPLIIRLILNFDNWL